MKKTNSETLEGSKTPVYSSIRGFGEPVRLGEGESISGELVSISDETRYGIFYLLEVDGKKVSILGSSLLRHHFQEAEKALGKSLIGKKITITYNGKRELTKGKFKGKQANVHQLEVWD